MRLGPRAFERRIRDSLERIKTVTSPFFHDCRPGITDDKLDGAIRLREQKDSAWIGFELVVFVGGDHFVTATEEFEKMVHQYTHAIEGQVVEARFEDFTIHADTSLEPKQSDRIERIEKSCGWSRLLEVPGPYASVDVAGLQADLSLY